MVKAGLRIAQLVVVGVAVSLHASGVSAAPPGATILAPQSHTDGFEGPEASWRVSATSADFTQLRAHNRDTLSVRSGERSEHIQIDATQAGDTLFIEQFIPPAVVLDELTVSLWVRGNRPGVRLGVRLVFPHQVDPRTGERLKADFFGDEYSTESRWQQLHCRTESTAIQPMIGRLQAQLANLLPSPTIETRGVYIDRVVLMVQVEAGGSEWNIDELSIAPVVDPAANGTPVVDAVSKAPPIAPVTMGDGRLLYQGRPYFPILTPYHGEELELLRSSGFNVLWIPDYQDTPLLRALAECGMGAMAEPPAAGVRPVHLNATGDGPPLAYDTGLPPFSAETSNILFWTLGAEVDPAALGSVRAAAEAVRDADPSRRPVLVDVTGSEREFHRSVDVLGTSRQFIHTSIPPLGYAAFLDQAAREALRGKPTFTWVFTEPNPAHFKLRDSQHSRPHVEPEQIWMQVDAAVASGVKGIGYFRRTPFDANDPASVERLHAIRLANLRLHLLRHWLAAGKVIDVAPVRFGEARATSKDFSQQTLTTAWNQVDASRGKSSLASQQVRAPVFQSDRGWLVLPHWLEPGAQYQPGIMAAEDVRIFLRGADAVHAWEVTTTGVYPYHVKMEPVAGGLEVILKRFDQHSAILISHDAAAVDEIKREAYSVQGIAAESWLALAEAKLARVRAVHEQLQDLEPNTSSESTTVLAAAVRELDVARRALESGNADQVRVSGERVLKLTRQVQRRHWEQAIARVAAPVSTPDSICFQTLPDFWKLMQQVESGRRSDENLLPGGHCDEWESMIGGSWRFGQAAVNEDFATTVDLSARGRSGRALHLAAVARNPEVTHPRVAELPIRVLPPSIPVFSGQIVVVTGLVRINSPVIGNPDGLMVWDNLSGTVGAQRWGADATVGQWQPIELIRPVKFSGEFQLVIELTGLGDIELDELAIRTITPSATTLTE